MTTARYPVFGVYVSQPVADALADAAYEAAGVVALEGYFDPAAGSVSADDPGAKATDALVGELVTNFTILYDEADFEAATAVDPDGFDLIHIAASSDHVAGARDRFDAAATIQETDLRTVQTAILAAQLDVDPR
jgi:hypothetical protein